MVNIYEKQIPIFIYNKRVANNVTFFIWIIVLFSIDMISILASNELINIKTSQWHRKWRASKGNRSRFMFNEKNQQQTSTYFLLLLLY